MNRKEKIAFLKGIAAGVRSITKLLPIQVKHWGLRGGTYTLQESDVSLTQQEFAEMEENDASHTLHFVHVHSDVPIALCEEEIFD